QIQSEGASLARSAAKLDFAAEQAGELAADSQPQSRSSVFPAGARICLLEGLENDALFIESNSNPRICDLEGDYRRRSAEDWMILAPPSRRHRYRQTHRTMFRKFERVLQQVLQHLLQALGVRNQAARELRIGLYLERQSAILRFVPERP